MWTVHQFKLDLCNCNFLTFKFSWIVLSLLTIGPTSYLFIRFKCRRNKTCQRAPMSLGRTNSIFLFNFLTKNLDFILTSCDPQEPEQGKWKIKFRFSIILFNKLISINVKWNVSQTRGPKGSKGEAEFEVAEYVLPKVLSILCQRYLKLYYHQHKRGRNRFK